MEKHFYLVWLPISIIAHLIFIMVLLTMPAPTLPSRDAGLIAIKFEDPPKPLPRKKVIERSERSITAKTQPTKAVVKPTPPIPTPLKPKPAAAPVTSTIAKAPPEKLTADTVKPATALQPKQTEPARVREHFAAKQPNTPLGAPHLARREFAERPAFGQDAARPAGEWADRPGTERRQSTGTVRRWQATGPDAGDGNGVGGPSGAIGNATGVSLGMPGGSATRAGAGAGMGTLPGGGTGQYTASRGIGGGGGLPTLAAGGGGRGDWADRPGGGGRGSGLLGRMLSGPPSGSGMSGGDDGGGPVAGAITVLPGMSGASAGRAGGGGGGGGGGYALVPGGRVMTGSGGGVNALGSGGGYGNGSGNWADRPDNSGSGHRRNSGFAQMTPAAAFGNGGGGGGFSGAIGNATGARPGLPGVPGGRGGTGSGGVPGDGISPFAGGRGPSSSGGGLLPVLGTGGDVGDGNWADRPGGRRHGGTIARMPVGPGNGDGIGSGPANGGGGGTGSGIAGPAGNAAGVRPGTGSGAGTGRAAIASGGGGGIPTGPFGHGTTTRNGSGSSLGGQNGAARGSGTDWADRPGRGGNGGGTGGNGHQPTGVTYNAVAVEGPTPLYPSLAAKEGLQGTVIVAITVSSAGTVEKVEFAKRSNCDVLDNEAIRTARKWQFQPAMDHGKPVSSVVKLQIRFEKGKEPEAKPL